jgi:hypothetical protein
MKVAKNNTTVKLDRRGTADSGPHTADSQTSNSTAIKVSVVEYQIKLELMPDAALFTKFHFMRWAFFRWTFMSKV